jgi:hypothetical protein
VKVFLLAVALLVVAGSPAPPATPVADQGVFGLWDADTNGVAVLLPTKVVPLDLGVAYGWRLRLTGTNTSVTLKQVLTLPAKPVTWGKNKDVRIARDDQSAVLEEKVRPQNGWLIGVIQVADGDPEGKHTLEVIVDGRSVTNFEFETKHDAKWPGE